jgi:hypothetical protein
VSPTATRGSALVAEVEAPGGSLPLGHRVAGRGFWHPIGNRRKEMALCPVVEQAGRRGTSLISRHFLRSALRDSNLGPSAYPSVRTSTSQEIRKPSICRYFQAAEGTRTVDLLHGKQNLSVRSHRFIPACRPYRHLRRAGHCLRFRRFWLEFWHSIGTETRSRADVASAWSAPALQGSGGEPRPSCHACCQAKATLAGQARAARFVRGCCCARKLRRFRPQRA